MHPNATDVVECGPSLNYFCMVSCCNNAALECVICPYALYSAHHRLHACLSCESRLLAKCKLMLLHNCINRLLRGVPIQCDAKLVCNMLRVASCSLPIVIRRVSDKDSMVLAHRVCYKRSYNCRVNPSA